MAINSKTIFWNKCDIKSILEKLSGELWHVNNDFNGENGEDFVSDDAIKFGFKSDMEYTVANILAKDKNERLSVEQIVRLFLMELFDDYYSYPSWDYEILEHPTFGTIGVSIFWTVA